jgi:hypothetical protein
MKHKIHDIIAKDIKTYPLPNSNTSLAAALGTGVTTRRYKGSRIPRVAV